MMNIKKVCIAAMTAAAITASASALVMAAPEPVKVEAGSNFMSSTDDASSKILAEAGSQVLHLSEEDAEKYPALAKALEEIAASENDEINKSFNENLENAREAFMEAEDPELFGTYTDTRKIVPQRSDAAVVSFLETISAYTGGAHGTETFAAHNIDPETGKEIALSDVVKDEEALKTLVKKELKDKYPEMNWDDETEKNADKALENPVFTIGSNGLTFWFDNYAIGSYAEGTQNVTVLFDEDDEDVIRFNEKFTDVPESYSFAFPESATASIDLEKDGDKDKVTFFGEDFDGYQFRKISVKVNDETASVDGYSKNIEGTFVKRGDRTFLYIQSETDNDAKVLNVFALTSGAPEYVGRFSLGLDGGDQLTDPTSFKLIARTSILGSLGISGQYSVGEDGTPVAAEDIFTIDGTHTITAKKDLALKTVDENGDEKDATIAAGTELTLSRTDNRSFVDATEADGTIVRIHVATDGTHKLADGQNIEDAFDGIGFAG